MNYFTVHFAAASEPGNAANIRDVILKHAHPLTHDLANSLHRNEYGRPISIKAILLLNSIKRFVESLRPRNRVTSVRYQGCTGSPHFSSERSLSLRVHCRPRYPYA